MELNYEYFIRQINREEEILKLCESDNIIKLYKEFKTKNYIILELEYCGIDLSKFIKIKGPLNKNRELFYNILEQLSEALKILHGKGIIHRDIKPCNIFIDEYSNKIKLGGFGCSTHINSNKYKK